MSKGFTLIELMVVVAIIAVMAGVAFVTVNPASYFATARDQKREVHINSIHGAVIDYALREGELPPCVIDVNTEYDAMECSEYILNGDIPVDPLGDECEGDSGYKIKKNDDYTIGVSAPCAEKKEIIVGEWYE